jgi:hypothetical protein
MKAIMSYLASGAAVMLGLSLQPAFAQGNVEIGALGLISTYSSANVTSPVGSGTVGPGLGLSGGFVLGQTINNRWGGEFRYVYFRNDLELKSGSESADLGAQSHAIHYDLLYYFSDLDAKVRPYVAGGFGMKYYQGTGAEDPFQPMQEDLAILTKTNEVMPAGDFGVGVKWRFGKSTIFRLEFRDYVTAVPKKLITPAPGADLGGLLHHWAPFFGITWTF